MRPGPRNLLTDVPGVLVGNAEDHRVKTGVTVVTAERRFVCGVHVMGGAPGTRETDLLAPDKSVQEVDAIVLSGGSAFGLDAAGAVAEGLLAQGRGFSVGDFTVPIVPAAIIFDLSSGGDKDFGAGTPYRRLGRAALDAAGQDFAIGTAGAGTGATTAVLKGGLGSASLVLPDGGTVGALAAVNPVGSVTMGDGPHFWAAPFEIGDEFGGLGPGSAPELARTFRTKLDARVGGNTVIAVVATDVALSKAECTRLATAAHDGLARAIVPAHTHMDGDLVFAMSTGARQPSDPLSILALGHAAALCLSRAVARAVHAARPAEGDPLPCWQEAFGGG